MSDKLKNDQVDSESKVKCDNQFNVYTMINTYILEVTEIIFMFTFLKFILNKEISIYKIFIYSLTIGAVILLLGMYNEGLKKSVKGGILASMGAKLITFD